MNFIVNSIMTQRLWGLDLLRSIILLFGPTYHASMLIEGAFGFHGYFEKNTILINLLHITNPFRMELFFIISGFFAALIYTKKGKEHYIKSRKNKILRPTFYSIVFITPITAFIIYYIIGYKNISYVISYRHVWFLVTLSIISLLSFAIMDKVNKLACKISKTEIIKNIFLYLSTLFILSLTFKFLSIIPKLTIGKDINYLLQITPTIKYLGSFLCGILIYKSNQKIQNKPIYIGFILYIIWYIIKISILNYETYKHLNFILEAFFATIFSLSIFFYFRNIDIENIKHINTIRKFSSIALPFYLIHLPILIFISYLLYNICNIHNEFIFTIIVIIMTISITYLLSNLSLKSKKIRYFLGQD